MIGIEIVFFDKIGGGHCADLLAFKTVSNGVKNDDEKIICNGCIGFGVCNSPSGKQNS